MLCWSDDTLWEDRSSHEKVKVGTNGGCSVEEGADVRYALGEAVSGGRDGRTVRAVEIPRNEVDPIGGPDLLSGLA